MGAINGHHGLLLAGAVAPFDFMLDTLSVSAASAFSFRRLRTAYAGSACRVRRSSDNAEMDVGFASNTLDYATMLAWSGSDSVYVSKMYDQTGNSRDFTTFAAADQPLLVNAGSLVTLSGTVANRPVFRCNGSSNFLALSYSTAQPYTNSSVLKFLSVASGDLYSDAASSSVYFVASGSLAQYAGASATFKTGISANDIATLLELKNGGSSVGSYNGTETTTSTGTLTCARQTIGGAWNGSTASSFTNIECGERIVFASSVGSTDRALIQSSQKAFWGTP